MLLRADRHVWTGAELLVETSGNHSLASSPALEPPPPLSTHNIHTYTHFPCFSLTVSVRLEEACCYTITLANLASGRQASLYHPPPPPFPQETGPISGVPLHSSRLPAIQAVRPFFFPGSLGNSMSVRNDAALSLEEWNSTPEDLFWLLLFIF